MTTEATNPDLDTVMNEQASLAMRAFLGSMPYANTTNPLVMRFVGGFAHRKQMELFTLREFITALQVVRDAVAGAAREAWDAKQEHNALRKDIEAMQRILGTSR